MVHASLEIYQRRDNGILMVIPLTFQDVECGFKKTIITLDGRHLTITNASGELDMENYFDIILDEGIINRNFRKGQLFIVYDDYSKYFSIFILNFSNIMLSVAWKGRCLYFGSFFRIYSTSAELLVD